MCKDVSTTTCSSFFILHDEQHTVFSCACRHMCVCMRACVCIYVLCACVCVVLCVHVCVSEKWNIWCTSLSCMCIVQVPSMPEVVYILHRQTLAMQMHWVVHVHERIHTHTPTYQLPLYITLPHTQHNHTEGFFVEVTKSVG